MALVGNDPTGAIYATECVTGASGVPKMDFRYGGVSFEISSCGWKPSPELGFHICSAASGGPIAGHVMCAVTCDHVLADPYARAITCQWDGSLARVAASGVEAVVTRSSPKRYRAEVSCAAGQVGTDSFVSAVSACIVQAEGGMLVHGVPLVLGGVAVLLVGPSGAGKSTAADQCSRAHVLSFDRAALVPHGGGWQVWGLSGGHAPRVARTVPGSRPLAGVLRVRKARTARNHTKIEPLSPTESVFLLREHAQGDGRGLPGETALLGACERLAGSVPVADLWNVLGQPLRPVVERWIEHG